MVDSMPRQFGSYSLVKLVKGGGEAEVWKATDTRTRDTVALRILKGHENTEVVQRRFENEIEKLKNLNSHPHIIPLLDSGWDHGQPYLVMPYIEKGTLRDQFEAGKLYLFRDIYTYLQQAADALGYAHSKGIIHRDVKPDNLLLGEHGVLLSDFGIAIEAEGTLPPTRIASTAGYGAPEQEAGKAVPASDQYALAVTWCRLLTGQLPFPMGLRELQEKYPEIAVVLRRALEREPDKRFESVKAFANAINDAALNDLAEQAARTRSDSLVLAAPPLPRKVSYGIPSRRLPASWIVSGVLVALLLLLIGGLIVSVPLARLFVSSPTPTTSGSPVTLCLATDLPLNGTERVAGRAIRNGVELALAQSPLSKPYHGYIVRQDDMDDSSNDQAGQPDATAGIRNIQSLPTAACPQPIAIIGPVNSPLAVSEIPVAAANKILLLSPSNTAPCLTQPNWSDPPQCIYGLIHPQGFNTYARLPGTDIDQGYLDADLIIASKNTAHPAQGGLGAQKVEIVGDEEVYGTQVALAVIQEMKNKGLLPVGIDCLKPQDEFNSNPFCSLNQSSESFPLANIDSLARKIRDEQADAVFFGGRNDRGADRLRKALEELGLDNVPFIGADALVTEADAFFQTLGDQGSNVYATFPAVDPSTFISESGPAAEFFSRYQNKFGTSPESYSSNGFDAANIILQSIKTLIDSGKPVNAESVTRAVLSNDSGKDDFMGVVGNRIHFDQNGDNTGQRLYTVYQSQQTPQGTWNWGVLREQTSV